MGIFNRGKVTIKVLPRIDTSEYNKENIDELVTLTRDKMLGEFKNISKAKALVSTTKYNYHFTDVFNRNEDRKGADQPRSGAVCCISLTTWILTSSSSFFF